MMAAVARLGELSLALKISWAVWLSAAYATVLWRRHGRTAATARPARTRKAEASAPPAKRRWRLRANAETPVLQQTSMLGL